MPQPFNNAAITDAGIAMLARAQANLCKITFTRLVIGDGHYDAHEETVEKLQERTALKSQRNSYPLSSIEISDRRSVSVTALITNFDLVENQALVTEGYYINEMGLYAKESEAGDDTEVLYSIVTTAGDQGDFLPPYNGYSPAQIIQEYYVTVGNSNGVSIVVRPNALVTKEMYDAGMAKKADLDGGDASDMISDTMEPESQEDRYPGIDPKSPVKQIFGRLYRWVKSLKADKVSVSDLVDNCTSTATDKAPTARQAKVLWDKIVDAVAALTTHKSSGDHDGRYYTETEMDTKLGGKSNTGHTHDDRYFTESEITTKLNGKSDTGHGHSAATQSANGLMSAADKKKLDGVATGANNYSHPSAHAASMITQDATHRFVSDSEKSTWNGKAAGNHNHDSAYVKKDSTAEVGGIRVGDKATDGYGWIDIYYKGAHCFSIYPQNASTLNIKAVGPLPTVRGFNIVDGVLDINGSRVLTLGNLVDNCTSNLVNAAPTAKQAKLLMDKCNQLNSDKQNILGVQTVNSGNVTISANSSKEVSKDFTVWSGYHVVCVVYVNINGNVGLSVNSGFTNAGKTCIAWINNPGSSAKTVNVDWGILVSK